MPLLTTGTAMIAEVRQLADIENATTRFTDAEILAHLNSGISNWWDALIAARGWSWCGKTYLTYDTVAQTGSGSTVTFSGTPVGDYNIVVTIDSGGARGVATFKWSVNSGTDWEATGVLTAASVTLGNTGIVVNFGTDATPDYTTGDSYSCKVIGLKTKSNKQWYDLPSDFYKMQNVMISGAGWPGPVEVLELNKSEEAIYRYNNAVSYGVSMAYQLKNAAQGADMIGLFPVPSPGAILRINYFPYAPQLATTSSTLNTYNSWGDEYAIHFAVHHCALKDENFEVYDRANAELKEIEKRIISVAASGRTAQAPQIQNRYRNKFYRRTWWTP